MRFDACLGWLVTVVADLVCKFQVVYLSQKEMGLFTINYSMVTSWAGSVKRKKFDTKDASKV